MSRKRIIITAGVAAVIMLAGMGGGYVYADTRANGDLLAAQKQAETVDRKLSDAIGAAQRLADETTADSVADQNVLTRLSDATIAAGKQKGLPDTGANRYMMWTLLDARKMYDADARNAHAAIRSLSDVTDAVNASVAAKKLADARNALQTSVDAADRTYADSDGKVADNATRDALKQAIDEARSILADDTVNDPQRYEDQKGKVDAAAQSVTDSRSVNSGTSTRSGSSGGYARSGSSGSSGTSGRSSGGYGGTSSSGGTSSNNSGTSSNNGTSGGKTDPDWLATWQDSMGNHASRLEGDGWSKVVQE